MPGTRISKRKATYSEKSFVEAIGNYTGGEELKEALSNLCDYIDEIQEEELGSENKEKADKLNNLYYAAIKALDNFEEKNMPEQGVGDTIFKKLYGPKIATIRNAIGKDMRFLGEYRNKLSSGELGEGGKKSFSAILEDARSKTVEVKESEIEYAGAGQNVRAVVKNGDKKVFFTESARGKNQKESEEEIVAGIKKKYGSVARKLDNPALLKKALGAARYLGNNYEITGQLNDFNSTHANYDFIMRKLTEVPRPKLDKNKQKVMVNVDERHLLNNFSSPDEVRMIVELIKKIGSNTRRLIMNNNQGIRTDSKQDKRNSATYMIAERIGCPNVIAKSENLKLSVKNEQGNVVKTVLGTAMDEAKGTDNRTADSKSGFMYMSRHSFENNPKLVKDVADLQVVDYIVGNPDRHVANFTYVFDAFGKLAGIQGIDNDTDFGAKFQATSANGKAVSIDNMAVISKSTAEKVLSLDKEEMRVMLYGFDLTKAEVEASVKRLESLQAGIRLSMEEYKKKDVEEGILLNGIPRVVDDDKLSEYSFGKTLAKYKTLENPKGKVEGNLFGQLLYTYRNPQSGIGMMRENDYNKAAEAIQDIVFPARVKFEANNVVLPDIDGKYQTGSENFTNMRNASQSLAEDLRNFTGGFFKPVGEYKKDEKAYNKDYVLTDEAKQLKERITNALTLTDKYINEKMADRRAYKWRQEGTRAWKRFQYALKNQKELKRQLAQFEKAENAINDMNNITKMKDKCVETAKTLNEQVMPGVTAKVNQHREAQMKKDVDKFLEKQNEKIAKGDSKEVTVATINKKMIEGFVAVADKKNDELRNSPGFGKFKEGVAYAIAAKSQAFSNVNEVHKYVSDLMKQPAFDKMMKEQNFDIPYENCSVFASSGSKRDLFRDILKKAYEDNVKALNKSEKKDGMEIAGDVKENKKEAENRKTSDNEAGKKLTDNKTVRKSGMIK